jgi:hypothetical protein
MIPTKPSDLAQWLETATEGIASSGKERIRREIEAHYAEAVEAHLAKGEAEPVAQANALGELGNARTAGRRFRRRHLTEREERRLLWFQYFAASGVWLAVLLFFSSGLMALILVDRPRHTLIYCVLNLLLGFAFPCFAFWKMKQPESKLNLYSAAALELSYLALITISYVLLAGFSPFGYMWSIYLLMWIPRLFLSFQTWKKLRKNENAAFGDTPRAV